MYFHSTVREAKRAELLEGLAEALAGPFEAQTHHLVDREMVGGGWGLGFLGGWGERRFGGCLGGCAERGYNLQRSVAAS